MRTPLLALHIAGGTLGMLSGFAAMFLRKGSRRHSIAGDVFVVSMLIMSTCGTVLAVMKSQPGNVLGGTFTFYLVSTAWLTARRREAVTNIFDWAGLLLVATVAVFELTYGMQATLSPTGLKYDYPPGPYFFIGSFTLLAATGDIRMLLRGGICGADRIARHLWRMCFAQFIAAGSIFLARQQLFPVILRRAGVLYLLSFLPLIVLLVWLLRVRFASEFKRMPAHSQRGVYALPT